MSVEMPTNITAVQVERVNTGSVYKCGVYILSWWLFTSGETRTALIISESRDLSSHVHVTISYMTGHECRNSWADDELQQEVIPPPTDWAPGIPATTF